MKLIRSWPQDPPKNNHPYVHDNCERVYIPTIDYTPLLEVNDDVIQLDWDVAVGRDEIRRFAKKCLSEPDLVRIAPVMRYESRIWRGETYGSRPWNEAYMAKVQMPVGRRQAVPGDLYCCEFGFSLTYLPRWTLEEFTNFAAETGCQFRDREFADWYYVRTGRKGVPMEWDIYPVHLNYDMSEALQGLEHE